MKVTRERTLFRRPSFFCVVGSPAAKVRLEDVRNLSDGYGRFRCGFVLGRKKNRELRHEIVRNFSEPSLEFRRESVRTAAGLRELPGCRHGGTGQASHETASTKPDKKSQGLVSGQEKVIQNVVRSAGEGTGGNAGRRRTRRRICTRSGRSSVGHCTKSCRNSPPEPPGAAHEITSELQRRVHETMSEFRGILHETTSESLERR